MTAALDVAPWVAVLMLALIPYAAHNHRRAHRRGYYRERR